MRLPIVNPITRTKKQEGVFGGLDTRSSVQDGYFADMKNMSSDHYPAAGPRQARGETNKKHWRNQTASTGKMDWHMLMEKNCIIRTRKRER